MTFAVPDRYNRVARSLPSQAQQGSAMPASTGQRKTEKANDKASAAFVDFVELGDGRSLAKLAEKYRNSTEPVPTRQLSRLKIWCSKYNWIERIAQFEDEQAEAKLAEANRLDADTFLATSRIANDRIKYTTREHIDTVLKIRESVRKPQPKGGTSVSVSVSVTPQQREIAERIAASRGVDTDEVIQEIEEYLRSQKA